MLEALETRVKEAVWFGLIDHMSWPNKYFRDLGYFSLYDVHRSLLNSTEFYKKFGQAASRKPSTLSRSILSSRNFLKIES